MVPSFASWYAISLFEILMCALTFNIVMWRLVRRIWWTIAQISSLSGWLCWDRVGGRDC